MARRRFTPQVTIMILLGMILLGCWACSGPGPIVVNGNVDGNQRAASPAIAGELRFNVPAGWVSERQTSQMRFAQYKLPHVDQDGEDASLVVYYFGAGQGGSTQANLDRWIAQMQQPDGSDSKVKAKTQTVTVNALAVTTLDVGGTYTAEMTPGAGNKQDKSGYRLRAAVVETPKGPYFVKLVGPSATMARWDQSFAAFVNSFEFK